jgi:hypothetical protein
MTKRLAWALILSLVVTACVAHEKAGDQAAALGDWSAALAHYGQALAKEPDSPELKEKYERARREAVADAYKKAQACAAAGDWSCAVGEADFALQVDSGNREVAAFRADAARAGLKAEVRGRPVQELARELIGIAAEGLRRRERLSGGFVDERTYLVDLEEIAESGITPAERLLERYHGPWGGDVSRVYEEFAY